MTSGLAVLTAAILLAGSASAAPIAGMDIGAQYEARVRAGIEQNRKSSAVIKVTNGSGRPVVGAKLKVSQISSDFLFGCAFPAWKEPPQKMGPGGWKKWNEYFTRLFNYATSENSLKWQPLEPREGEYNWAPVDFMVDWCKQRNIKIKGHTLVWGYDKQGIPQWMRERSKEEIEELMQKRIGTVMKRYENDIPIWDVVNEPIHVRWYEANWRPDYVVQSYKLARKANPNACLVINDYAGFRGAVDEFVPYVKELLQAGAPIDAIGEQAHDSPWWYTPEEIFSTLDKMASTGLPIHLTELTYPSDGSDIEGGFVTGKWDEENQGKFYRYFMTLAFSHPNVEAITLWAMWDGSTWLKHGGIVREDWTPKHAYHALDDLINNKWRTRFEAVSDVNGEVRFRGFHGVYRVEVTPPGAGTRIMDWHLAQMQENRLMVVRN